MSARACTHIHVRPTKKKKKKQAREKERERASVIDLFSSGLGISGLRECTQCSTDTRTLTERERASEFRENTRGQVRMCVCMHKRGVNRRVRARKFENKAYVRWSAAEMMRFVRRARGGGACESSERGNCDCFRED